MATGYGEQTISKTRRNSFIVWRISVMVTHKAHNLKLAVRVCRPQQKPEVQGNEDRVSPLRKYEPLQIVCWHS